MEHVVYYTGADGASQHARVASLEDAVALVGHLRNSEGVEDCTVYALTEVPLTVKAVYVVEVPGASAPEPAQPADAPAPPPVPVSDVDAPPAAPEAPAPAADIVQDPEVETIADPLAEMTVPSMEPVVAEPVAEEPVVAEPAAVEPAAAEPAAVEPAAVEPAVVEPAVEAPAAPVEEPVKVEANGSARGLGFFAR